ncbi:MAG: phosphoribosylformylglycinamidine synthase subunit PurS [Nitrososphaeria archaeon]|jgi:phosphoribosylformylglycinamidine synthase PurS subunit
MARYTVRIEVWLREGLVDPEGRTVSDALSGMGFPVSSARAGRIYEISVDAPGAEEAMSVATDMCEALLANPVRDSYHVEVLG